MPLNTNDVAAAGDAYLKKLGESPQARAGLTAAKTPAEVARHIASVTGMNVDESDVGAIADHLNAHRAAECERLAMQYPAMGSIFEKEDEPA
jgi:hypothetical protein